MKEEHKKYYDEYNKFLDYVTKKYAPQVAAYYKLTDDEIQSKIDQQENLAEDVEDEVCNQIREIIAKIQKKYEYLEINYEVTVSPISLKKYRHNKEHEFYWKRSVYRYNYENEVD